MNSKLRILLADDSRFFRGIESQFLQKVPVEILEAEDCAAVLDVMQNEKPDLVFVVNGQTRNPALSANSVWTLGPIWIGIVFSNDWLFSIT